MEPKSDGILTSVKLWFLLPLPCKITVFTAQNPSKNETKSLQKKTLQPDPPKIVSFPSRATLDGLMNRKGFQKGSQNWGSRAANFEAKTSSRTMGEFWNQNGVPMAHLGCHLVHVGAMWTSLGCILMAFWNFFRWHYRTVAIIWTHRRGLALLYIQFTVYTHMSKYKIHGVPTACRCSNRARWRGREATGYIQVFRAFVRAYHPALKRRPMERCFV